jgi:hypothetical protein
MLSFGAVVNYYIGLIVIGSAAPDQKFPAYPVVELYAVSVLSAIALEAK